VWQSVTACCSVLPRVAVSRDSNSLQSIGEDLRVSTETLSVRGKSTFQLKCFAVRCGVLQWVAIGCSVLQCVLANIHTYMHTYIHTHIHTHKNMHVHICIQTYTYT